MFIEILYSADDDFEYNAVTSEGFLIFNYPSRDEYLYGNVNTNTSGFVIDTQSLGTINLWLSTTYALCQKNGKDITAQVIGRGGDNILGELQGDGSRTNTVALARIVYTIEKKSKSSWKIVHLEATATFPYGIFQF